MYTYMCTYCYFLFNKLVFTHCVCVHLVLCLFVNEHTHTDLLMYTRKNKNVRTCTGMGTSN